MSSQPQSRYDLATLFHSEVPDALLKDLCRAICRGHQQAHAYCSLHYRDEEAHDARAHICRAHVDTNIRDIVPRHEGVTAKSRQNVAKNCFHACVYCGRFFLTASSVSSPGEIVREAEFRNNYAFSNQFHLFEKELDPPKDGSIYGIILHGESKKHPGYPSFLQVAFLHPNGKEYIAQPIDLLRRFPDIRTLTRPDMEMDQEDIKPEDNLRFRKKREDEA